jgi:tetratricopeptide (TPR) repeat protein
MLKPRRGTVSAEQGQALFRTLDDPGGAAVTLNILGCVARDEGDFAQSITLLEQGLALLGGQRDSNEVWGSVGFTLLQEITLRYNLAISLLQQGDLPRAVTITSELSEMVLTKSLTSSGRFLQAMVALEQGDLAGAAALGEDTLALGRQVGLRRNMALALSFVLGPVQREQGNLARAVALSEESLALGRELQDGGVIGWACLGLGLATCERGDAARALAALAEGLRLFQARGMRWFMARCLAGLTQVACLRGQMQRAAPLAGATEALLARMNAPLPRGDRAGYGRAVDAVRAALGNDAFTAAYQAGQALPLEQVVAAALDEPCD